MKFWDTSALVPLVIEEKSTEMVRSLLEADGELAIWWGTPVEWHSTVERLVREGLSLDARERALAGFRELYANAVQIQPVESLRARALRLLRLHTLRAADALQLSAALHWCRERTQETAFVCLDERLRIAARSEGFAVLP